MIDSLNFDVSGTPCLLFHAWLLLIFDIGGTPCLLFHACRLIILRPAVPCDSYFMHVAYYIWGQRHSMTLISCMSLIWYSRVYAWNALRCSNVKLGIVKIKVKMHWALQGKIFLGSAFHASFVLDKDGIVAKFWWGVSWLFWGEVSFFFRGGALIFVNRVDFTLLYPPPSHTYPVGP